jgi:hypothetical protein
MERVEQKTENDCMVACLAMLLDIRYEEIVKWFELKHRDWHLVSDVVVTLIEHGYGICFLDASGIGRWGGVRRFVGTLEQRKPSLPSGDAQRFGHAFVIDENENVHDPSPKTPTSFDMGTLFGRLAGLGLTVEWVAKIVAV